MKSEKGLVHASQALFAVIVLLCLVGGCGKRQEKSLPEVYPAEEHAYMRDPAFMAQLAAQKKEKDSILGAREKLFAAFAALEKREGSRAAAERSPEWKVLERKARACLEQFESNRLHTTAIIASRLKQAQADSERIARGEARAATSRE